MARDKGMYGGRTVIWRWQVAGFLAISVLGSLLHFAFEWSGRWKPVALVAAVNESTWEHLKLAFWPSLLFYAVEWVSLGRLLNNVVLAATVALYVVPAVIVLLFYSYTALLGHHVVAVDVGIFVAAVALGQVVHYRLVRLGPLPRRLGHLSILLLLVLLAAFSLFTYHPPELLLFRDPVTGGYGLMTDG